MNEKPIYEILAKHFGVKDTYEQACRNDEITEEDSEYCDYGIGEFGEDDIDRKINKMVWPLFIVSLGISSFIAFTISDTLWLQCVLIVVFQLIFMFISSIITCNYECSMRYKEFMMAHNNRQMSISLTQSIKRSIKSAVINKNVNIRY